MHDIRTVKIDNKRDVASVKSNIAFLIMMGRFFNVIYGSTTKVPLTCLLLAKRVVVLLIGLLAVVLAEGGPAAAQTSTDPWDWIIQHVCADASDHPIGGCPEEC